MRKRILIIAGAFIIIIAVALGYLNYRNRTLSPPGQAEISKGDLTVSISYSRPSVRNRLIFGTSEDGALQPYGEYWRLGANESTEITFNKNVLFNGKPIAEGTYRMYAIPGKSAFQIVLNTELGKWGAMEPDYTLDILKTEVPVEVQPTVTEQHTITLEEANDGIRVVVQFEKVKFSIPIVAQ